MTAVAPAPTVTPPTTSVLRRLHAGTMPPQGVRQPDSTALHMLTEYLESALDREAALRPKPGRAVRRCACLPYSEFGSCSPRLRFGSRPTFCSSRL